ncbi:MAG: GtrA family protein [Acutalibacteraceae bacterium]|nr:GtrA family protein [Acutalibacteraceae bacterium]
MKEFFTLLIKFDLKGIFITPTKNGFLQFFRYVFVGGIATVVDLGVLFVLTDFANIYHLISAIIAFVAGLITNFFLSKLLVFKSNEARVNAFMEFVTYAIIGVIGLGITELIMFILTDCNNLHYMLSKIIATMIVLAWNYIARKMIIYKK